MRSSFLNHGRPFLLPTSLFLMLVLWFLAAANYSPLLAHVPYWQFIAVLLFMTGGGIWAMQIGGKAVWAVPISLLVLLVSGVAVGQSAIGLMIAEEGMILAVFIIGMLIAGNVRWSVHGAITLIGTLSFAFGYRLSHISDLAHIDLLAQLQWLFAPLLTAAILCCLFGEAACHALFKTHHRNVAFAYGGLMLAVGILLVLLR